MRQPLATRTKPSYNDIVARYVSSASTTKVGPLRVADLLRNVVGRLGIERDLDDYRIWAAWDEVVGPAVARNAQPIRLDKSKLVVAVKNATWMQELSLLRHDLSSRLNAWMGREVITEIFLIVGRIQTEERRHDRPAAPPAPVEPRAADVESAIARLWKAIRERDRG